MQLAMNHTDAMSQSVHESLTMGSGPEDPITIRQLMLPTSIAAALHVRNLNTLSMR